MEAFPRTTPMSQCSRFKVLTYQYQNQAKLMCYSSTVHHCYTYGGESPKANYYGDRARNLFAARSTAIIHVVACYIQYLEKKQALENRAFFDGVQLIGTVGLGTTAMCSIIYPERLPQRGLSHGNARVPVALTLS